MTTLFAAGLSLLVSVLAAQAPRIDLAPGATITRSTAVRRAVYSLPSGDETGKSAAVTVRGDNLVVDFSGATLRGTPDTAEPDQRRGTGIRVEGRNVTIKNLRVRGYKIGLVAFDSPGLRILDCDLSYNWKQRLASTLEREDGSDWMSFHRNEKDEWLRYGAGIYLRRCDGFEVRNVTVRGGQCGLMLMECGKGLVWNSDFSFLSGIGLGMYYSSNNRIMHNRIDWCVRGYSHGVYNRGQDSAGILIYEQSCRNTFAYNSVTHGGDGFFLWAGQTTMDTGQGGCNDNLVYGNDFSHAPTNGIEATFSRNAFVDNLVMECWHGIWGGYSFDTSILDNVFAYNAEAIAIEHGQNNTVRSNTFYRDGAALHVWQNERQDLNWGYPKHHDTRSHGYDVAGNLFSQIARGVDGQAASQGGPVLLLKATSNFRLGPNRYGPTGPIFDVRGPLEGFVFAGGIADVPPDAQPLSARLPTAASGPALPPMKLATLGTGWDAAHEGHVALPGRASGLLPGVMLESGNNVLPYPEGLEGYRRRFVTVWNPLRTSGTVAAGGSDSALASASRSGQSAPAPPRPLVGGRYPYLRERTLRGRAYILVDAWGPYDFQSPRICPRKGVVKAADKGLEPFELLGPPGHWSAAKVDGGELSATSGSVPGMVWLRRHRTGAGRLRIELSYVGEKTVDFRGVSSPAGARIPFTYTDFRLPIDWRVRFYRYDRKTQEPRTQPDSFSAVLKGAPLAEMHTDRLDLAPGLLPPGVPNDYFATAADGTFEVAPGDYVIETTTDDGARLFLDGKPIVDEWRYQGPTLYSREVKLGGRHTLHVEHFQIDGYWTLKVAIRPKSP